MHLHKINILTCKQPSRSSSSSFCTAVNIPGTKSPSTPVMEIGDCRTTAATRCTVVLCLSTLPSAANEGSTYDFNSSLLNRSGDDTGTNWEIVRMARLRTAGRGWSSRGEITVRGWVVRGGEVRCAGKRVIRIERIESVSIRVSGGVKGYL